jgi:hypothetical protein
MGILLDINEDNAESEGWRIEGIRQKLGIIPSQPQKFPTKICPICQRKFFSDHDLNNHIFDIHRHETNFDIAKEINLDEETEITNIDYSDIDNLLFDLQTQVNQGKTIDDWYKYKQILNNSNEHYLRKQYLEGIIEYIYSHYREIQGQGNSNNIGKAYGNLEKFAPYLKIAQQIRHSIAFKMSWFDQLSDSGSSLFFLAWHFFTQSYEVVNKTIIPLIKGRQEKGVIIDDFHQEVLEVLQLYYCDRSNLTYTNIKKLELLSQNINNPNYINKLTFLKARIFREWEDFAQAQQNYRKIRNHFIFGKEASSFNV